MTEAGRGANAMPEPGAAHFGRRRRRAIPLSLVGLLLGAVVVLGSSGSHASTPPVFQTVADA